MIRFDFLHDPRPALVERLASLRLPREIYLQAILAAVLAVGIAVAGGVEAIRLHAAESSQLRVRHHFEAHARHWTPCACGGSNWTSSRRATAAFERFGFRDRTLPSALRALGMHSPAAPGRRP